MILNLLGLVSKTKFLLSRLRNDGLEFLSDEKAEVVFNLRFSIRFKNCKIILFRLNLVSTDLPIVLHNLIKPDTHSKQIHQKSIFQNRKNSKRLFLFTSCFNIFSKCSLN